MCYVLSCFDPHHVASSECPRSSVRSARLCIFTTEQLLLFPLGYLFIAEIVPWSVSLNLNHILLAVCLPLLSTKTDLTCFFRFKIFFFKYDLFVFTLESVLDQPFKGRVVCQVIIAFSSEVYKDDNIFDLSALDYTFFLSVLPDSTCINSTKITILSYYHRYVKRLLYMQIISIKVNKL